MIIWLKDANCELKTLGRNEVLLSKMNSFLDVGRLESTESSDTWIEANGN